MLIASLLFTHDQLQIIEKQSPNDRNVLLPAETPFDTFYEEHVGPSGQIGRKQSNRAEQYIVI